MKLTLRLSLLALFADWIVQLTPSCIPIALFADLAVMLTLSLNLVAFFADVIKAQSKLNTYCFVADLIVVGGRTGSGKTAILLELEARGEQARSVRRYISLQ